MSNSQRLYRETSGSGVRRGFRIDGFLVGMVAAVALAWWWPEPGARGGVLHAELLNKLGVALIFWLHGLTLPWRALRAGTVRWQLHLLVQASTFIALPLLGWLAIALLGEQLSPSLRTGTFFLCALPSTVSTSVALTALARGNVPAALFNATLSSLIGVFATPLWLGLLHDVARGGAGLPLADVIVDLSLWLLLPLALGQLLRPVLGRFAEQHKPQIHRIDRGTILLLIYTSFCDSFAAGVWSGGGLAPLLVAFGLCVVLLATIMLLTNAAARALRLSPEDRIVAIFCGSKKSLASGVPMARLLFGSDPTASVILLPLMLYHPLQLVVCGWFATRWASRDSPAAACAQA
jgi:solute carrier family 10 (sodium/bile acid cotransporter), member 7